MARDAKNETIKTSQGPTRFVLVPLGGMKAGLLFLRLTSDVGPGVAALAGAFEGNLRALPDAVRALFEKLTPAEFEFVALELLNGCSAIVKGKNDEEEIVEIDRALLDKLFKRHVAGLFLLVWAAFRENYESFFEDLAEALGLDLSKFAKKMIEFGEASIRKSTTSTSTVSSGQEKD